MVRYQRGAEARENVLRIQTRTRKYMHTPQNTCIYVHIHIKTALSLRGKNTRFAHLAIQARVLHTTITAAILLAIQARKKDMR